MPGSGGKGGAIKAGQAYVELGTDMGPLKDGLDKAKRMTLAAAKAMAAAGAGMIAIGGAVKGGLAYAMSGAIDRITGIRKAAEQLGTTTEIMSALGYAGQKAGVDLDGMVDASRHLDAALSEAAKGSGAAADAFKEMGIDASTLIGLPIDEKFARLADGLKDLNEESRKVAIKEILGRGGADLLPILREGSGKLKDLANRAKSMGAIVSTEDAAKAKAYAAALGQLREAWSYLVEAIGTAAIPSGEKLKVWSDRILMVIQSVRRFVDENRETIMIISAVATGLIGAGAAFIAIGTGLAAVAMAGSGFAAAIGIVGTVLSTLWAYAPVAGIMLGIAAAVAGLAYVLYEFTPAGEAVRATLRGIADAATWAWGVIKTAWEGISAAFQAGDMGGALDIAKQALQVFWVALQYGARVAWNKVKETALNAWDDIVGAGKKAVVDLRTELKVFGTDMVGKYMGWINSITNRFVDAWKEAMRIAINITAAGLQLMMPLYQRAAKFARDVVTNPGAVAPDLVASTPGLALALGAAGEMKSGKDQADAVGQQKAEEIIRAEGERLKAAIDAATEMKKNARNAADLAKAEELLAQLKQEELKLQQMTNEQKAKVVEQKAKVVAQMASKFSVAAAMLGLGISHDARAGAAAAAAARAGMASMAQGSFSAINAKQAFGSRQSPMEAMAKDTKRVADNTDEIKKNVGARFG